MNRNSSSPGRKYTVDEAAQVLGRSVNSIENLIRNEILGFEIGQFGLLITSDHIANFYLGRKPIREPEFDEKEKCRPKIRKRYVKAKTRR